MLTGQKAISQNCYKLKYCLLIFSNNYLILTVHMYKHSFISHIHNFMQLSSYETLYVRKYNSYEKEQYSKHFFHNFCDLSCYVIKIYVSNSYTRLDNATYLDYQLAIKHRD